MYKRPQLTAEEEIARIRMPKEGQLFAIITEMLGASRFRADCIDEKTRICRVPGRLKRRCWVRTGDLILIEPWKVQAHERADLVWKYTRTQANWLKRRGKIGDLDYE